MSKELFSWGKFFSGIVDPIGYFKTLASFLRILVVIGILFLSYCIGVRIYSALVPKKIPQSVFTVNAPSGGEIKNSADQKQTKFGLFNF